MPEKSFPSFVSLETNRLLLRELTETDANEVFSLRSDKEHNQYLDRPLALTVDDAKSFIIKILTNKQEPFFWAISLKNEQQLAGTIILWNLDKANNKAEVGYELLPAYQGRGLMEEAVTAVLDFGFKKLRLVTIEARTHPGNQRSIALLKKFSFIRVREINDNETADPKEILYSLNATDHL
jgi:[ribosomal protein S5]-alanine N-acetyltransferase